MLAGLDPERRKGRKIVIEKCIEDWHQLLRGKLTGGLDELLADDVVFHSPIVFTPQKGKDITKLYLSAAFATVGGDAEEPLARDGEVPMAGEGERGAKTDTGFRYTKELLAGNQAFLEFETELEGKYVNGVDIITCNAEGKIVEFKVMIRPLQAVNLLHQQMASMLEKLKAS
jgi:hypothetical protein